MVNQRRVHIYAIILLVIIGLGIGVAYRIHGSLAAMDAFRYNSHLQVTQWRDIQQRVQQFTTGPDANGFRQDIPIDVQQTLMDLSQLSDAQMEGISDLRWRQIKLFYYETEFLLFILIVGLGVVWLRFKRSRDHNLLDTRAETQFILNNAPGMICCYDKHGKFRAANDAYAKLVGVESPDDLKGRHISQMAPPKIWEKIQHNVERACNGEFIRFEVLATVDGEEKDLLATYRPMMDKNGDVAAIIALIMDITDRHKAETALRLSEENLRITLDSIGDAVISIDTNGEILRMNPQAARMTGWSENAALSQDFAHVCHLLNPNDNTRIEDPLGVICDAHSATQAKLMLKSSDGSLHHIAASGAPLRDPGGNTIGTVLVFHDITEEYILGQRLAQDEKLKSLGHIAGGISHDFNNILAGMQSALDLMFVEKNLQDSDHSDLITHVNRLIKRGAGLTEQLTLFARVKKASIETVNVCTLLGDSLAILRNTSDRRITFDVQNTAQNVMTLCNESSLQTAMLNILLNGIEAISDIGHIGIRIANPTSKEVMANIRKTKTAEEWISIQFADSGRGIDEKVISKIFDPFFTTKDLGEASGLGLAATYGTIDAAGGDIVVTSEVGKGSVFTIYLPCVSKETHPEALAKPFCADTPNLLTQKKTILFADDEELFREATRISLERLNYNVISACDGGEALEQFWKHKDQIDIIILDMNMPVKSGAEVIDALGDLHQNYRIFLSTGYSSLANQVDANDIRITGVLEKPYKLSQLASTLQTEFLH